MVWQSLVSVALPIHPTAKLWHKVYLSSEQKITGRENVVTRNLPVSGNRIENASYVGNANGFYSCQPRIELVCLANDATEIR